MHKQQNLLLSYSKIFILLLSTIISLSRGKFRKKHAFFKNTMHYGYLCIYTYCPAISLLASLKQKLGLNLLSKAVFTWMHLTMHI